ncbi:O-antigen polymerase [Helicobacter pylori Hp M2]|uniref:O-antigen polymerase n=1 Tax=Helicobacter pylori Hp H-24 TaxID=992039 RepID=J0AQR5_HELPX|nr:O-antigen polymerase [Helicobacter pylori Hp H-24]EJC19919.1 O-Antigen ligase family protein [Helicobacter pylori Hp H-24b]EJC40787.1 O-antigen polymerase [Helicobacter pylori Hp M1]EJC42924.1 O-antigen polymerase [Helicobacter pylori Hp M2]EJC44144.1 O-antigen polymerase [Helicobacter pylori Hp M3]EJC47589.1 O-antigen polymerase [Helicobacter pylori Hp M5]EJC60176.1 O-antigen polymerase [Helicobacter pylori Hp M9]
MKERLKAFFSADSVFTLVFALFFLTSFKKPLTQVLLIVLMVFLFFRCYFQASLKETFTTNHLKTMPFKWLTLAFLGVFLSIFPNMFNMYDSQTFRYNLFALNMSLTYACGALCLLFSSRLRIKLDQKILFYSMAVANFINGLLSLVQKIYFNMPRAQGFSTVKEYVVLVSVSILGCYIYALYSQNQKEKLFFTLSVFVGFLVVILSATRSATIAFVATFLILSCFILYAKKSLKPLGYMVVISLVLSALYMGSNALEKRGAIEQSRVQNQSFEEDLKRYAKKDADSSIGWRLERWKEALTVLRLRPFFGMAASEKCQRLEEILSLSQSYRAKDLILCYERYDNQIIHVLATRGIIGFLIWLFFLLVIVKIFWSGIKQNSLISFFILMTLAFYLIFGIGFDPFDFFITGSFFVGMVMMVVFLKKDKSTF